MWGDDDWCHLASTLAWWHFLSLTSVLHLLVWTDRHGWQEDVTFWVNLEAIGATVTTALSTQAHRHIPHHASVWNYYDTTGSEIIAHPQSISFHNILCIPLKMKPILYFPAVIHWLLHAEHAVLGGASLVVDSTEMTCCAECRLSVLMWRREQGVCLCVLYARMLFGSVPLTSNTCASCLYST